VLFEDNHIYENARDGVNLRHEREANAPHNNTFLNNMIENNGTGADGGYGFSIHSPAQNLVLKNNTIRNEANGGQKAAVYIDANGLPPHLEGNAFSGHQEGDIRNENKKN
jgi:hypothetical protein